MIHARISARPEPEGGEVVAFPAKQFPAREFGRRESEPRWSLVVDLAEEEMGPRWCRGAATLALLCTAAILLAPGLEPLPAAPRFASAPVAPRFASAPVAPVELGPLGMAAVPAEAAPADPDILAKPKGLQVGERGGLTRVSGEVAGGLYWSLRGAGASPQLAAAYLQALSTRIDMSEVSPFDRFEFVLSKPGEAQRADEPGRLVYAGLDRAHGDDVQLLKWTVGGRVGWFDGSAGQRSTSGLLAPVAGRVTSSFGTRVHPILRFRRFHSGIDFGAPWGSPIVAAADGQVVGAGWSGGYGRQVRIAHGGGVTTSYSHMSSIAAGPGTPVRQGQLIGYVGSSGFSTGPHLHFEVRVSGRPVNPLSARLVSRPVLEGPELAAFKARLKQLLSIATTPA